MNLKVKRALDRARRERERERGRDREMGMETERDYIMCYLGRQTEQDGDAAL